MTTLDDLRRQAKEARVSAAISMPRRACSSDTLPALARTSAAMFR